MQDKRKGDKKHMRNSELQKTMRKSMKRGIRLLVETSKRRKTDPNSQEQILKTDFYSCPQCGVEVTDVRRLDAPSIKVQKQCPVCKTVFFITRRKIKK